MRDFLNLLNSHEVEYLVCGGHAVGFHGYPRLTMDLDVLVKPTRQNAVKVMAALKDFGFGEAGIDIVMLLRKGVAITLGSQPNQIDILTSISKNDPPRLFNNKVCGVLDDIPVGFVAKDDLLRAKRAAGRAKDLADVEELEKFGR